MSPLPFAVWLQATDAPPPALPFWLPMVAIFLIFYLLVLRPQQKQRRQHAETLKGIEKGDAVVTSGGLHGKVTGVTDEVLTLEIASIKGERVRVKVSRPRIETVQKAKKSDES